MDLFSLFIAMDVLSISTDCSGIEAPLNALKQLKIPFIQKWSCEIDKYAILTSAVNYSKAEIVYEDMLTRDNTKLPNVDLYVCGFPCQSFSNMGNRLGTNDLICKTAGGYTQFVDKTTSKYKIIYPKRKTSQKATQAKNSIY